MVFLNLTFWAECFAGEIVMKVGVKWSSKQP